MPTTRWPDSRLAAAAKVETHGRPPPRTLGDSAGAPINLCDDDDHDVFEHDDRMNHMRKMRDLNEVTRAAPRRYKRMEKWSRAAGAPTKPELDAGSSGLDYLTEAAERDEKKRDKKRDGKRDGTFGPPLGDEDERPKNAGRGRPRALTGSKRSRDVVVKSERDAKSLQASRAPAKRGKSCSSKGIIGAYYDLVEDPSKPAEFGGVGPPGTFYHAKTCLPVERNKNVPPYNSVGSVGSDADSDDDEDLHTWAKEDLRHLSDFEDVAPLEKRFMHDWNVFVRRFRPCADKEVPDCLSAFARFKGKDLAGNRQLRRLFTLHLVNAYDFGVIEARVIDDVLKVVEEQRGDVKR